MSLPRQGIIMKAIHTQLQINRVTIRPDDSVSFSAQTPELSDDALLAFRKIAKTLVNALLEPEAGSTDVLKIERQLDGKSPSQRLRAVLYVLWEQDGRPHEDFEVYYRIRMNAIIDWVKGKLE